jgi:hypothetical protein
MGSGKSTKIEEAEILGSFTECSSVTCVGRGVPPAAPFLSTALGPELFRQFAAQLYIFSSCVLGQSAESQEVDNPA